MSTKTSSFLWNPTTDSGVSQFSGGNFSVGPRRHVYERASSFSNIQ